jgi:hypothetical protein
MTVDTRYGSVIKKKKPCRYTETLTDQCLTQGSASLTDNLEGILTGQYFTKGFSTLLETSHRDPTLIDCYTQGVSLLTDACFFSIYFVVRFMLFVILDVSHFAKKCAFRFSAAYFRLNTGKLFLYLHNDNIVILFVMFVFVLFYIPFQLCYL